ncbi:transposase [Dyadobacter arcticus]|uniref:REP element-mobilizing transposase RayT n=1 Tax=Dyadobacter arcticus TaxID=1078754 RepID=A0ABX0USC1_9BACT|nr:transposase [Dyadobacter arcticus]NIJ54834.1 REP element-mobilizing transposase RayT [Dyadobacter arcticus]
MSRSYSQVYIHFVLAVRYRQAIILPHWKQTLHNFITAITQNNGHDVLAIGSMPDHLHLLVNLNSVQSMSDFMEIVQKKSKEFINQRNFTPIPFEWQEGFGGFSISILDIEKETRYVFNQEQHHRHIKFRAEFIALLREWKIPFDDRTIFEDLIE